MVILSSTISGLQRFFPETDELLVQKTIKEKKRNIYIKFPQKIQTKQTHLQQWTPLYSQNKTNRTQKLILCWGTGCFL